MPSAGVCVCARVCVCDARPRCVHRADCSRQWMSLSALSAYQCCRGEPAQEVRNSLQSGEEERRGSQGGLEQSRSAVLCRVLAAKNDPKVGNIYNTPRWTTVHPLNFDNVKNRSPPVSAENLQPLNLFILDPILRSDLFYFSLFSKWYGTLKKRFGIQSLLCITAAAAACQSVDGNRMTGYRNLHQRPHLVTFRVQ